MSNFPDHLRTDHLITVEIIDTLSNHGFNRGGLVKMALNEQGRLKVCLVNFKGAFQARKGVGLEVEGKAYQVGVLYPTGVVTQYL